MGKKKTTEEFVADARLVHGDRYCYNLVKYEGNKKKVKIICREHGVFEQSPDSHLHNHGCPKCSDNYNSSTESFIEQANRIHKNKYDYSLVEYVSTHKKVKIICKEHGIFEQRPSSHIRNHGCPKCSCTYASESRFIERAKLVHDEQYDYSLIEYKNNHTKVKIICREHGVFEQKANNHLMGHGCKKCNSKYISNEIFIQKAVSIHGSKYNYNLTQYKNSRTKVKITCPVHGVFEQTANSHLAGHGCKKCGTLEGVKLSQSNTDDFILRAIVVHGDRYDYSLVDYVNNITKIKIICKEHGVFEQLSNYHLYSQGCPKCSSTFVNTEMFIEKANHIHKNKYDYSLVNYINNITNIQIICKKHGSFLQIPTVHLSGANCPKCSESRGEKQISQILEKYNIQYKQQIKFPTCKNILCLPFDFAINIQNNMGLIEYNGEQHYIPIRRSKNTPDSANKAQLKLIQHRDNIKKQWCLDNEIPLLVIPYTEQNNIENKILEFLNILKQN